MMTNHYHRGLAGKDGFSGAIFPLAQLFTSFVYPDVTAARLTGNYFSR
jgi:hypothetical protein